MGHVTHSQRSEDKACVVALWRRLEDFYLIPSVLQQTLMPPRASTVPKAGVTAEDRLRRTRWAQAPQAGEKPAPRILSLPCADSLFSEGEGGFRKRSTPSR